MLEDDKPDFVKNMMTICNVGLPAEHSSQVQEVLRYHINQMRTMEPSTLEFKAALCAAQAMDRQVQYMKARELCPDDMLWYPGNITAAPVGEDQAGGTAVSPETPSEPTPSGDPTTTSTVVKGAP